MSKGKKKKKRRESDKSRNKLLTIESKLMITRGEVSRGTGKMGDGD